MTRKLITLMAACGLTLGGLTYLHAQGPSEHGPGPKHEHHHGPGPGHDRGNPLEHLTKDLNLTDEQKAKVQPIIDQTKPQIEAIHQEAMEKMHAIMESTGAQIRPLLTPEQQQKFDAMKKAHEDMRKAMQEMHDAKKS
ncbi:MAG TPA: Spy/CpxP family protein refolding chaperone [Chthoniobacterales bacterium]|nr:Spy/CpxP family protein refolding chaperone [Chthoniobacterales bacterium]